MRFAIIRNVYCIAVISAISASSISCNRRDPNIPKVHAAVTLFNDRFNKGQFHEIYANTDPVFQKSISEQEFTTKLRVLLEEHGHIESSGVNGVEGMTRWQRIFPGSKPTRFIGVYSRCKTGGFQEFFVFNVVNDEARILEFGTSLEELNRKLRP